MAKDAKKKKIVVAMSGGVDSSVTAVLLKEQGFDVVGIFMKFWKDPSASFGKVQGKSSGQASENSCCSAESEKLARAVAKKVGIPFYVFNVEREFKKKVVDYFLKEYKEGRTPNPCVVCNKEIKFGLLLDKALKLGADFVATGHYARLQWEIRNPKLEIRNKSQNQKLKLLKAKDENKDQSYVMWQLNQKQLSHILFPIGEYTKPEVRKLAEKFGLPTAETPESQEVCFVQNTTNDFLKKYLKTKPGLIIDITGKVLGRHNGLWFYTIGQRRGLEIQQGPWFVVGKDFKKNVLIISKNKKDLLEKELVAENVNWILPQKLPINAEVKIRYKSDFAKAKILNNGKNKVKIIFTKPQKAITPGQSAVFYKGEKLLGGGVIL